MLSERESRPSGGTRAATGVSTAISTTPTVLAAADMDAMAEHWSWRFAPGRYRRRCLLTAQARTERVRTRAEARATGPRRPRATAACGHDRGPAAGGGRMRSPMYARKRWALCLIRRCPAPPPAYGSSAWLALPEGSAEKVATVCVAAESWASTGDLLEEDLRREIEVARLTHKQAEGADYFARAAAHRQSAPRPGKSFAQRRAEQLTLSGRPDSRPRAGESSWGA